MNRGDGQWSTLGKKGESRIRGRKVNRGYGKAVVESRAKGPHQKVLVRTCGGQGAQIEYSLEYAQAHHAHSKRSRARDGCGFSTVSGAALANEAVYVQHLHLESMEEQVEFISRKVAKLEPSEIKTM